MKKSLLFATTLLTSSLFAANVPQSADGSDGFGVFSSSGGSGSNSGTFTGASDIGNPSWGFFANSGETSQALYDIGGGALSVGQSVLIQMDNGTIQNGATIGIGFQNISNANDRFEFNFLGFQSNYSYIDGLGLTATAIPFTSTGLNLEFELTGTDSYAMTIAPIGGSATQFTGSLGGTAGSGIDRIRLFNANAGPGSGADLFFNNLEVVPEPSSYALLVGLMTMAACCLRRKRL